MNESNQFFHVDWAGKPIRRSGFYGGRTEFLPREDRCDKREKITQNHLSEVLENGPLPRALAAKKLQHITGASRASCYRALEEDGRFAKHLRFEADMVRWRERTIANNLAYKSHLK
jgi:predicted DNA-binding transcriptional regulator AlpA